MQCATLHRSICLASYCFIVQQAKIQFSDRLLSKELGKKNWKKFPVNVCGISDCYQPAEIKYEIMPDVIRFFIINENPLVIVTKSILLLRDMELIKELNELTEVSIIISVSTLDEKKRKLIEPNAAPTIQRLEMLKKFKEIGCNTAVLFMPIIPYISDDWENLNKIFKITKEYDLGSINAWPLHLHGKTKGVFYSFLRMLFPELLSKYKILYKNGSVSKEYGHRLHKRIRKLRDKYQLYEQYRPTQPKADEWTPLTLFV